MIRISLMIAILLMVSACKEKYKPSCEIKGKIAEHKISGIRGVVTRCSRLYDKKDYPVSYYIGTGTETWSWNRVEFTILPETTNPKGKE